VRDEGVVVLGGIKSKFTFNSCADFQKSLRVTINTVHRSQQNCYLIWSKVLLYRSAVASPTNRSRIRPNALTIIYDGLIELFLRRNRENSTASEGVTSGLGFFISNVQFVNGYHLVRRLSFTIPTWVFKVIVEQFCYNLAFLLVLCYFKYGIRCSFKYIIDRAFHDDSNDPGGGRIILYISLALLPGMRPIIVERLFLGWATPER
jgi:hypothetical protein